MKVSAKTQYGLRAMVLLAKKGKMCSSKEIAKKEGIPAQYLEKIISELEKAKLVKAKRGAQGGYILAKNPREINAGEIIKTLEGTMAPVLCIAKEKGKKYCCPHEKGCLAKNVWQEIQDVLNATLSSITLEKLIKD